MADTTFNPELVQEIIAAPNSQLMHTDSYASTLPGISATHTFYFSGIPEKQSTITSGTPESFYFAASTGDGESFAVADTPKLSGLNASIAQRLVEEPALKVGGDFGTSIASLAAANAPNGSSGSRESTTKRLRGSALASKIPLGRRETQPESSNPLTSLSARTPWSPEDDPNVGMHYGDGPRSASQRSTRQPFYFFLGQEIAAVEDMRNTSEDSK